MPEYLGNPVELSAADSKAYVRLYEEFDQKSPGFIFEPNIDYANKIGDGYYRDMMRVNLKSVDINLPKLGGDYAGYDKVRRVEIWSVYGDAPSASLTADFYNSYLEPEFALRANPGKYKPILRVLPGQHVVANFSEPIKKILLIAIL